MDSTAASVAFVKPMKESGLLEKHRDRRRCDCRQDADAGGS
jgi:hypothetical protein